MADVTVRFERAYSRQLKGALPRLSATAEIETIDGKHAVVDPLLADWIELVNRGHPDPGTDFGG
jgi:hypothetical protein